MYDDAIALMTKGMCLHVLVFSRISQGKLFGFLNNSFPLLAIFRVNRIFSFLLFFVFIFFFKISGFPMKTLSFCLRYTPSDLHLVRVRSITFSVLLV